MDPGPKTQRQFTNSGFCSWMCRVAVLPFLHSTLDSNSLTNHEQNLYQVPGTSGRNWAVKWDSWLPQTQQRKRHKTEHRTAQVLLVSSRCTIRKLFVSSSMKLMLLPFFQSNSGHFYSNYKAVTDLLENHFFVCLLTVCMLEFTRRMTTPKIPTESSLSSPPPTTTPRATPPSLPIGECFICAELVTTLVERRCCGKTCCQICLYRHIQSVFEEGQTGTRRKLSCPLGCGVELSDADIRECFHRQHRSYGWERIGRFVYGMHRYLFRWLTEALTIGTSSTKATSIPTHFTTRDATTLSCRTYRAWWYWLHTRAEQRDLVRYERWSITTALAELTRNSREVVMHCPAVNCDYSWLMANPSYRETKRVHENQPVYFWYSPPRPDTVPLHWVEPDFLNLEVTGWIPQDIDDSSASSDGRRMVCGKCGHVFCGLCRHPWMFNGHKHIGISCQRYARKLPRGWDSQDMASWESTRACPGCRMNTSRISGCNHMVRSNCKLT